MAHTSAADLAHSLKGAHFPISKKDLTNLAKKNGAPKEVVETIQGLPDDEFDSVVQVEKAFSQEDRASGGSQGGSSRATGDAQKGGHQSHRGDKKR